MCSNLSLFYLVIGSFVCFETPEFFSEAVADNKIIAVKTVLTIPEQVFHIYKTTFKTFRSEETHI